MDVVAINQSLILATFLASVLAGIIAFCAERSNQEASSAIVIIGLGAVSIAVILVMLFNIGVLRRQIIEVIAGIYRTYR